MGTRRLARELGMQALFFMDKAKDHSQTTKALFIGNFNPAKSAFPFLDTLIDGVLAHRQDIDALIERHSSNWKLSRMACVDRNVMRIAVFELLYCDDIPPKVSINEAIDIGKKFGTDDSGAFINGILDSIHLALGKSGALDKKISDPQNA